MHARTAFCSCAWPLSAQQHLHDSPFSCWLCLSVSTSPLLCRCHRRTLRWCPATCSACCTSLTYSESYVAARTAPYGCTRWMAACRHLPLLLLQRRHQHQRRRRRLQAAHSSRRGMWVAACCQLCGQVRMVYLYRSVQGAALSAKLMFNCLHPDEQGVCRTVTVATASLHNPHTTPPGDSQVTRAR